MKRFDPLESWLDNVAYSHSDSRNTRAHYKYNMERFCGFTGKTPEEIVEDYEQMNDRAFKRKYASAIKGMIAELHKSGSYASSTIRTIVACVKSFFKYNDLPLSFIPTAKARVTYHNKGIEREEIAEILRVANPRDRAFFAFMAQSGLRPSTSCRLRIKHLEKILQPDTPIPCKVSIPQAMAKGKYRGYFTFIADEAVHHLKSYLKTRTNVRDDSFLFTKHGTEERLSRGSITHIFKRIADQLNEKGIMDFEQRFNKPSEIRLYNLRKWFRKNAGFAGYDYVHFWMGHKLENQDEHYFNKHDIDLHRKQYKEKAMPMLKLMSTTSTEMEKTIKRQEQEIKDLHKEIDDLQRRLKTRQNAAEYVLKELGEKVEKLESQLNTYIDAETRRQQREEQEEYFKDPKAFLEKYGLSEEERELQKSRKRHRK